jgi:LysR family nitrogen assimilation transcriptional regulator
MDLKQLDYFVSVADCGSFSRAAVAHNLAQPSLSRQVALLEEEMGQRLLERTGRGVVLTEAGRAMLAHAKVMLNAAARAKFQIREMDATPRGKVVVGLPHRLAVVMCAPLIERFRARCPEAMITVVEGLSLSLRDGLISGRIDVGLLYDPAPTPLLKFESLLREPLVLVAPVGYRLPGKVSVQALKDFTMVLPSSPNPIRTLVDHVLQPRKINLKIMAEVGGVLSALSLVEQGVACSILPEGALAIAVRPDRLTAAPIGPPVTWNHLKLALPASRPIGALTLEAVQVLRKLDYRHQRAAQP